MDPQGATAGATAPCGEGERLIAQSISVSATASDFVIVAAAHSQSGGAEGSDAGMTASDAGRSAVVHRGSHRAAKYVAGKQR